MADADWVKNDVAACLTDPDTSITVESNPRAAARLVTDERFDVAIVDMQVGSMGGMAIVRMLKDAIVSGRTGDMAVILLLDRSADRFLAHRAGADGAVVKPFTSQDLRGQLASLTG